MTVRSIAHLGATELSIEQAKMVAYRAVADAIEVAAVYLGPPIQMCVVTESETLHVERDEIDGGLADAVQLWKVQQREALGPLAA